MKKSKPKPRLFVFAGANGSGKSSTRRSFADGGMGFGIIIDTDEIARSINSGNQNADNLTAAREAIRVANDCLEKGVSFCIETTLGGRGGAINQIRAAKEKGYEIQMFYLGLDRVEANIERVAIRVKNGGHDIPEDTIRTRYVKSTQHLLQILDLLDELFVIDNSLKNDSQIVMVVKAGKIDWQSETMPDWAMPIREFLQN